MPNFLEHNSPTHGYPPPHAQKYSKKSFTTASPPRPYGNARSTTIIHRLHTTARRARSSPQLCSTLFHAKSLSTISIITLNQPPSLPSPIGPLVLAWAAKTGAGLRQRPGRGLRRPHPQTHTPRPLPANRARGPMGCLRLALQATRARGPAERGAGAGPTSGPWREPAIDTGHSPDRNSFCPRRVPVHVYVWGRLVVCPSSPGACYAASAS